MPPMSDKMKYKTKKIFKKYIMETINKKPLACFSQYTDLYLFPP